MEKKETVLQYGRVSVAFGDNGETVFGMSGELDHHSVKEIRETIDSLLVDYHPADVTLDLGEVTFADSAGLGLILGRYTRIKDYGGELSLCNVSGEMMKILRLAGTDRLIKIKQKEKALK